MNGSCGRASQTWNFIPVGAGWLKVRTSVQEMAGIGKLITPVFLSMAPSVASSGFDAGPFGPSTWLMKYLVLKHHGSIPSGTIAKAGKAVAVGTAVLVGAGVAVGGTAVGDGRGVLVGGISVGVAVGGFNCGIAEHPEALINTATRRREKTRVLVDLFFNIFRHLSIKVV